MSNAAYINSTREQWLATVSETLIKPLIASVSGNAAHRYRVSIGFPKGSRGGRKSIGQCWSPELSGDKVHEIFVSPELAAFEAVSTLLHEHIHGSAGLKCGHKGEFRRVAIAVGFVGKMTQTPCGPELKALIESWLAKLPAYPHAPLNGLQLKKQSTRMVKCECGECGYTVRLSRKWLEVAVPSCPVCEIEMESK
jgi:hypothetical protein